MQHAQTWHAQASVQCVDQFKLNQPSWSLTGPASAGVGQPTEQKECINHLSTYHLRSYTTPGIYVLYIHNPRGAKYYPRGVQILPQGCTNITPGVCIYHPRGAHNTYYIFLGVHIYHSGIYCTQIAPWMYNNCLHAAYLRHLVAEIQ